MFHKFKIPNWFGKAMMGFVLLGCASNSSANLVQNGGFEDGSHRNDRLGYMVLNPGDPQLDNWAIEAEVAWGLNPLDGFAAAFGSGFVDLSSLGSRSAFGEVKQQVDLVAGNKYLFSYYTFIEGSSNVFIDGNPLALEAGATLNDWTQLTSMFTASSSTLAWLSIKNATGGSIVFIDEISLVNLGGSEIPIPAAFWLFGTALVGLVGVSRRRKLP